MKPDITDYRLDRLREDLDATRKELAVVNDLLARLIVRVEEGAAPKVGVTDSTTTADSSTVWHDASKTLPPHGELVLALLGGELGGSIHSCVVVAWCKHYDDRHMWVTPGGCSHFTAETQWEPTKRVVTHWSACLPRVLNVPTWPGTTATNGKCVLPSAAPDSARAAPHGDAP